MKGYEDNRRPEEIASDIERTREEVSSTIDAIQSKLTPGQMMDQVASYARTSLPADFGANFGNAVRDNPVPVALVGIGLAWLMMSGQRSDGRARARRQAAYDRDFDDRFADTGYDSPYGMDFSSSDMTGGGSTEGTMRQAASSASETGRDMKERASETGHRLMDKASELGGRISETTSQMAGRAREAVSGARNRMQASAGAGRASVSGLTHRSQEQYYRAKNSVGHLVDEQPLVIGALGIAIGAALGAALPRTRREDEVMGRSRDDLLDSAKEIGREQAEAAKESVQRVAQVAKDEAQRTADQVASRTQGNGQASQGGAAGGAPLH